MSTWVFVSKGFTRNVGGTITEKTGKDISVDTFTIGLGPSATVPPTVFTTPTVNSQGTLPSQRVVKTLINNTVPPGTYYVWATVVDNPEIEPLLLDGPIVVA